MPQFRAVDRTDITADLVRRLIAEQFSEWSTVLAARYGMRAADATHFATTVGLGAGRFITSNKLDFPRSIDEVRVTCPEDLPDTAR